MRPRQPGQAKSALMAALSGPYLHPNLAIAVIGSLRRKSD